ncbi:MAG: SusC/RagA family TonB-linked outer membrane protein, partial [Bacteroidaceae bacterium]
MKKYIILSLLMLCSSLTWAQKSVSGIVIDNVDKTPLLGATLMIKGTTRGTVTDFDGHFTLSKVGKNATLVISYLGYTTQEVKVNGRDNLMITMKSDANLLEDVVVVGYGSTKRSDLTGSVVSVNANQLVQTATSNFDEALAGRVAGVEIGASDGTPGEKQNIVIRGGNSITGDNTPLYVVDGMALEDFDPATLSTSNIADFQILKDASATAIYGSRGANGVIIISTKKGSTDGKSTVNVSLSHRYDWIPQRVQVLGAKDFVDYYGQAQYARDGFVPSTYYKSFLYSLVSSDLYSQDDFIDWQDKVFRGASTDDVKVSVSSGNKTTSFYYSGEYLNQQGTMINTSFKKLNNSLRVNHKFSSKASIDMKLEYSNLSRNGLSVRGNSYTSVIRDALQFRPVENKYNKIDESGYDPNDPAFKYYFDPVKNMVNTDRSNKQDVIRGSANYSYDIIKNLTFRTINSFQLDKRKESMFSKKDTYNGTRGINGISGQQTNREYTILSSSNTLSYNGQFKGGHKYSAMVGMEVSNRVYD